MVVRDVFQIDLVLLIHQIFLLLLFKLIIAAGLRIYLALEHLQLIVIVFEIVEFIDSLLHHVLVLVYPLLLRQLSRLLRYYGINGSPPLRQEAIYQLKIWHKLLRVRFLKFASGKHHALEWRFTMHQRCHDGRLEHVHEACVEGLCDNHVVIVAGPDDFLLVLYHKE